MATLRKRKNKSGKIVYLVDFYFNGRRFVRSTKTDDLKTAKLVLKDIEAKIAKNTFGIDEISPKRKVYLKQFEREYLEYSKTHKARKTYLADKLSFKNFIKFVGDRTLNSVDQRSIDRYLNARAEQVKKSSVNIEIRHLKAAFTKAVQWGYMEKNPFKGIKLFTIPEAAPKFFSKREMTQLLEIIKETWLRDMVVFAVDTGIRIGELVNVTWSDIDFQNRRIRISHKDDFVTKTREERIVPMNDEVFDLLVGLKRNGDYVFSTTDRSRMDSDFVSRKFKRYVRALGLNEEYTFHTLRHTFASHLVKQGTSLFKVSKLLGHADIKTTMKYAHLAPETLHDVVNLLSFQSEPYSGLSVVSKNSQISTG